MSVFVTGGSGYLGRAVVGALVRHGFEVTALARDERAAAVVAAAGAKPVAGGLTDLDVLRAAAASADGVLHLAQFAGPETAAVDLAAAGAMQDGAGDRPYVHTGGTWVYGDTAGVVDEDAPFAPPSITAWRLANERRVLARGGHPVIVMPGLVHGHRAGLTEAFFVEPARASGAVAVIGDGTAHWAVVHVDDVAELYVLALRAKPGSVYAGVSATVTQRAAALALSRAAGCPGELRRVTPEEAVAEMGPIAEAFALDQRFTGARARQDLGWRPRRLDVLADLAG
ncbi:NAD-dependent epimerase/dehydratase family protein [Umezawaea endophytica]|uniref:NAD-dependent epimerase/dehydratase family protein n=1 Tax=Umezawaea endophytica TaxID=1654476 RepID=A0A9X2VIT9_9PSEU|nr:NAD-dependent epimerase/dehydratase family protein [Umezawaea endophytica]MCS7477282.1 NAD-dependent epimerase/dehydratase family protein [Umezawaea endophytica]